MRETGNRPEAGVPVARSARGRPAVPPGKGGSPVGAPPITRQYIILRETARKDV